MLKKLDLLGIDFLKIFAFDPLNKEFNLKGDALWSLNEKTLEDYNKVDIIQN